MVTPFCIEFFGKYRSESLHTSPKYVVLQLIPRKWRKGKRGAKKDDLLVDEGEFMGLSGSEIKFNTTWKDYHDGQQNGCRVEERFE